MLPKEFTDRMKQMLGEEYEAFESSYHAKRAQALRVNPQKSGAGALFDRDLFTLSPVPWGRDCFYYGEHDFPGKHPYHEAGVYYIQEPSAMAPAEYLGAQPGERILDLCAAPGGKSTQIAAKMRGEGILFCNEIHPARAKILSENIERMGICNAIVTNETPKRLSAFFGEYFDRILVDAPCSGEGMFRKNPDACGEWSIAQTGVCAARQDEILDCAADMLRPGGRLVYSTCTFSPEENEGSVSRFLKRHLEYHVLPVETQDGMAEGNPSWSAGAPEQMRHTIHLFPHKIKGEGQFLAVLQKEGEGSRGRTIESDAAVKANARRKRMRAPYQESSAAFEAFCEENLTKELEGEYRFFGDQLYFVPKMTPSLDGLKVLRAGLHLGVNKKNRFEPSHALALFLDRESVRHTVDFASEGAQIRDYLRGQAIPMEGKKGWYLITTDGYSIGWGKLAGGIMKNHYPKGLRKQLSGLIGKSSGMDEKGVPER